MDTSSICMDCPEDVSTEWLTQVSMDSSVFIEYLSVSINGQAG